MPRVAAAILIGLPMAAVTTGTAHGECILANPSFEFLDYGTDEFSGWRQFGSVEPSTVTPPHGQLAARVSGVLTGLWEVSAVWQPLDSGPDDRWRASVQFWHPSAKPLTGGSRAILNIEWRDVDKNEIYSESHTVADASTPTDALQVFSVESQPAPDKTATARFMLGLLQDPNEPEAEIFYDLAAFDSLTPLTPEERQWIEFLGGQSLEFAGRTWRLKGGGPFNPGDNLYCDDTVNCAWVDAQGLHLTVQEIGGSWQSSEVALEEPLGYGDYIFTTVGRLDDWHPDVVLGLFLWEYGACFDPEYEWWNPFNEVDIEFGRWGDPNNDVGLFAIQPSGWEFWQNREPFDASFSESEVTSHAFRWLPDRVEFRSWRGGPADEAPETHIHSWTYREAHLPRPEQPRVHMNLWHSYQSPPDTDHEVVIEDFHFVPACSVWPAKITQVVIQPEALNSKSKGRFVTAYLEVPEPHGPNEIDLGSVKITQVNCEDLETPIQAVERHRGTRKHHHHRSTDGVVKFPRAAVTKLVSPGYALLTVEFELEDGTRLAGFSTVRVVSRGCGLGFELALLLPPLIWLRARRRRTGG